jgi:ribosomal protein L37AE/L43A
MSENSADNNNKKADNKTRLPPLSSSDEGPVLTPFSRPASDHVFQVGDREVTVSPMPDSPQQQGGPSVRYLKREHRDPEQVKAREKARFEHHVNKAMDRLRGGSNQIGHGGAVLASETEENLWPGELEEIIAEARKRLEQERKAPDDEVEQRQRQIQDRIREGIIDCSDCGQRAGNIALNPYALENHQKTCAAFAARIQKENEERQQIKVHRNKYELVLRSIDNVMGSMVDIRSTIDDLNFQAANAHYEKNPIILKAIEAAKEDWKSEPEYFRQQKIKRAEQIKQFADAVIAFYLDLEQSEEDAQKEPVWVAGE